MKKILKSLLIVGVVAILVFGATKAFFSDTEESKDNTFTAGAIDLKVDSTQHYNNAICVNGLWEFEPGATATVPQYPVIGSACGGTWTATDLGVESKFFNFNDVKPGDSGEDTISMNVINNDAWVCADVSNLSSVDNGINEPEGSADNDTSSGELDNTMIWTVWRDDGDNILESGEQVLYTGSPVNKKFAVFDSTTGTALPAGNTTYLGFKWELPSATGNEVQTDSLTADIAFRVEQARNNANFKCIPPVHVTSSPLNYGPTGWGGWSCPANTTVVDGSLVVSGGDLHSTVAWKTGASILGLNGVTYNFPTTPFGYTYGANESGFIGQNDNDSGESIVFDFDCSAN